MNSEIARIDASWQELMDLIQSMDNATLSVVGPDGWAVKDHIAHVAVWELSLLALIEGLDRPSAMGITEPLEEEGIETINAAIRKLHERETPDQVRKYSLEKHLQLVAALGKLTDADLQKPYSHYQTNYPDEKRPVIGWVAGNTYEHYAEHVEWIKERNASPR